MTEKLRTTGDWTYELLSQYYNEIEIIAKDELGLDVYPNQLEVISSQQMLDAYSTHAMPVMYNHWRFGKSFVQNQTAYDKGHMNLAYEIVSNTNPCISYLMDENSIMMMALVIAHAGFGHNYFFKNNYLFQEWTDASSIVDYLLFAKKYVTYCEEKYGAEEVEQFLDACHALELYGVDKYKRSRSSIKLNEHEKKLESMMFNAKNYDDVISSTVPKKQSDPKTDEHESKFANFENMEPEENLLYFLEKKAPYLEEWQREIIRIVRKVSQYFMPQRSTQLGNEGFAVMVHYYIMNRLYEKGIVDEGFWLEFLESHTAVIGQPGYDHPYYGRIGINVYALGFAIYMDIKRICMEPTDEDKEYFPWAGNGNWIETIKKAAKNYRDESFIQQFLSPKVVRDFKMFSILDDPDEDVIKITNIHNREGFLAIRDALAKMYDISERLPNLQVYKVDVETRTLQLRHISSQNKYLDENETVSVLDHLRHIWNFEIELSSIDDDGNVYEIFNC